MKQILPLFLVLSLMLCACGTPAEPTTTAEPTSAAVSTTAAPTTTAPTTESTAAPTTEPPVLYRNPLTGEPMEAPSNSRPVAVMFNNIKAAMPQHGVSQADILYEVLAEGGITRCMGVYSDISKVEALGSIRSARKYYVELARGYDALYVHAGGSNEALNYIKNVGWEDLDGVYGSGADNYFYRDQYRLNAGYSMEHTLFISGSGILRYADRLGRDVTRESVSVGLHFDDEAVLVGQSAKKVTVYFHMSGNPTGSTKSTTLTYSEADKRYYAAQYGSSYIDGNTGETVSFRNLLVLRMATSVQSDGNLLTVTTTGAGSGYFVCNGQMVPITWSRSSTTDPFVYTLPSGEPVTFGVGSTYIAVVPTRATVTFE